MNDKNNKTISYKDAGVDIDAGNKLVDKIKSITKQSNQTSSRVPNIGGFAALFEIPKHFKNPLLVACTDGVGTKLKLAIEANKHDKIGIDLVAMCANDLIVCGAEPLFFLDYYATSKLDVEVAATVIQGIQKGCEQANMSLVGGETAEMPGIYQIGDYDLAGFSVGAVEKNNVIDGSKLKLGDVVIGLASSGPHSNGYSLIRKLLETTQTKLNDVLGKQTFAEHLLAPTQIYVKLVHSILKTIPIHAIAHITGGGLHENIPRTIPDNFLVNLDSNAWPNPAIFNWIQEAAQLDNKAMQTTFNCGIGMTLCLEKEYADQVIQLAKTFNIEAWQIGTICTRHSTTEPQVIIS